MANETSPWSILGGFVGQAITALKPHGANPIVAVTLGCAGLLALGLGAPPAYTAFVVVFAFGAYFFGQERKAIWRRRELEAEFDALEKHDARAVRLALERRAQQLRNLNEPRLFAEQEVDQ